MRVSGRARRPPAGFTLLEVLVAFIIAAIAVAALLQGASGGLQSAQAAAHDGEAVARAQSRLALLAADMRGGEQAGDDGGGFSWRVLVQPSTTVVRRPPPARPGAPQAPQPTLFTVSVSITWQLDGGRREVTLRTQRLGTAPPDGP